MEQDVWLAESFEQHRTRLKAVANRMLGSTTEADDAVQETWLRFSRSDTSAVENLGSWLTTVVSRVCLNMLQARRSHPETPMDPDLPEPTPNGADLGAASPTVAPDPEQEALLAESVGLALLVVLDTLAPAERVALVLHDMFGVPFEEIAPIVGRNPAATRQLASRARRRVRGHDESSAEADRVRQARLVDAFLAASRQGDFEATKIRTAFTDVAGCALLVQLAAMGGVGTPELAAAVAGAGGLGMVPMGVEPPGTGAVG